MPKHNFAYGKSRSGKTTLAAQCAKAGMKVMSVTMEPEVTRSAFESQGVETEMFTPPTSEDLFVFLDYTTSYLNAHFAGYTPDLINFDNLRGLQGLIIGRPSEMKQEVSGISIPAKPATGIVGKIPKGLDVSNPEALSQAQYGVLGRYTRRLLTAIDNLPYHTLITSIEQLDFDEKYKKDAQGMAANQAAGRPRKVKGYPATEGMITKLDLPALVSGAFLHLVKQEAAKVQYFIHTRSHVDSQNVEWFADSRGLGDVKPIIPWTNHSVVDVLFP